jgi:hypothetical protein
MTFATAKPAALCRHRLPSDRPRTRLANQPSAHSRRRRPSLPLLLKAIGFDLLGRELAVNLGTIRVVLLGQRGVDLSQRKVGIRSRRSLPLSNLAEKVWRSEGR